MCYKAYPLIVINSLQLVLGQSLRRFTDLLDPHDLVSPALPRLLSTGIV